MCYILEIDSCDYYYVLDVLNTLSQWFTNFRVMRQSHHSEVGLDNLHFYQVPSDADATLVRRPHWENCCIISFNPHQDYR